MALGLIWPSRLSGAIEFSALAKQCLDCRIDSRGTLKQQVLAWTQERNEKREKINWLFDTPKAKLKRHYVKLNPRNNASPNLNN